MLWLALGSAPVHSQSDALMDAYNRSSELYAQGNYEEALPFAKKALKLGEDEFIERIILHVLENARARDRDGPPQIEPAVKPDHEPPPDMTAADALAAVNRVPRASN